MDEFVLGLDFGSDSVRALVVEASTGEAAGLGSASYRRWAEGRYSSSVAETYRHHPLDYVEGLEEAAIQALGEAGPAARKGLRGISAGTTASTPCLVDKGLRPLALHEKYRDDPDAMFILWKEHGAEEEAAWIGRSAPCQYCGDHYSPEWFWAKVLRVLDTRPDLAKEAASALELCDWIPTLLGGVTEPQALARGRAAAGHKALWNAAWGGFPDPSLWRSRGEAVSRIASSLGPLTLPGGEVAGFLCPEWRSRLGLEGGPVALGAGTVDAHTGALGSGIAPGTLALVLGTSACHMLVGPRGQDQDLPVKGICGQVDGSIIPGMTGYEAGQAAFGDVLAWFGGLLSWPDPKVRPGLLAALEAEAAQVSLRDRLPLAVDWFNGRRSPDEDVSLAGALVGLSFGCDAPRVYRALLESLALGSRAIVERYRSRSLPIERVVASGGVARKSPLLMQLVADVLDMEVELCPVAETVALGSAMYAAVAAGLYPDVPAAQAALAPAGGRRFSPGLDRTNYDERYARYLALGSTLGGL